ncbi:stage II sporulation protein P [Lederbergia sp. NSJ-179]|uniref:stage II sporulation protein P n=1 Tax=Lederbergia sp. NSJ-179 TaxID=2931402 RepID=UPI001FD3FF6B|nr:stage II sporulation protein P [Lederbergia sp. NSJ-179]MCJ7841233.1 stage II sporulation protein P [Lederbergia sp. NSJ-179]
MFRFAAKSSLTIIAIFCLTSAIAFSSIKVSFLSFLGNDFSKTESFLYIMSLENHSLSSVLSAQKERSLGEVALEFMTNINLTDMKTFLITEIPGLRAVTPQILIAGEGTDFTNLPIESPPPKDFNYWEDENDNKQEEKNKSEKDDNEKTEEDLTQDYKVYIYHTHTYESFFSMVPNAKEANEAFHREKNVTVLGKRLSEKLKEKGINTLVENRDVQALLNERNMQYSQSYVASREVAVEALNQNKGIDLVFDIHRDAARKDATTTEIDGKSYAKVMFVVGTGHAHSDKNLDFANELHQLLKEKYQGVSRGVIKKPKTNGSNGIYNQDLAEKSIVMEIGGIDNTVEELNRTVDALAEVISDYYWGEAVETSK